MGEGGWGLSGGQAQRVALARAFLRDTPLVLLDEPTAHLDPGTEAEVIESLQRLCIGRTAIIASHSAAARARLGRVLEIARAGRGGRGWPRQSGREMNGRRWHGAATCRASSACGASRWPAGWPPGSLATVASALVGAALLALAGQAVAGACWAARRSAAALAFLLLRPLIVLRPGARWAERMVTHAATFRALADTRVWFFRRLAERLPAGIGLRRSGDLLGRMVADVEALDGLYLQVIVPVARGAADGAWSIAALLAGAPLLAAAVALPLALALRAAAAARPRRRPRRGRGGRGPGPAARRRGRPADRASRIRSRPMARPPPAPRLAREARGARPGAAPAGRPRRHRPARRARC